MLILVGTTDKLQLVTSAAVTVDVVASYVDLTDAGELPDPPGNTQVAAITIATTTDIVAAPGADTIRKIQSITIRNKHASSQVAVTVLLDRSGTDYELHAVTLAAGDMLEYEDGIGWFVLKAVTTPDVQYTKLTADMSSTTVTALADVTGVAVAVISGRYYHFKFGILYQSSATTNGIRLSVAIPAATRFAAVAAAPVSTAADGTANIFLGHITSSNDAVIGTGTPATSTDHFAEVQGIIIPSADGLVQLRYGSEVTTANVTVRQGTMGRIETWP